MSELLPKPRREVFIQAASSLYKSDLARAFIEMKMLESERDYYKRLAEFAVEALEKILKIPCIRYCTVNELNIIAREALSTIKQSEQS